MKSILDLLYPRKCVLCQKLLTWDEEAICPICAAEYQPRPVGKTKLRFIDGWYSLWRYQDQVRESIHRFKFSGRQNYGKIYARLLATQLLEKGTWDIVTGVPISRSRYKSRGYDQGRLLAQGLASELGIPEIQLLRKILDAKPQSTIHGEAHRRANVLGAYVVRNEKSLKGKRILLVDDVLTTGSTASECARTLKTAGADTVYLVTVAVASGMK